MALRSLLGLLLHPREGAGAWLHTDESARFADRCRVRRRMGTMWGLLAYSESSSPTNDGERQPSRIGSQKSGRS